MSDETKMAIKMIKRAFRLNPIPPPYYYSFMAIAYRVDGQYKKAIKCAKKSVSGSPNQIMPYITMAVSYSLLDDIENANIVVNKILEIDPKITVTEQKLLMPYKHEENVEEAADALRKAGLPD
jgi:adenylate cyclase